MFHGFYSRFTGGSLPPLPTSNWFQDPQPALIPDRALPRFPFPSSSDAGGANVDIPTWLTREVWQEADKIFGLPAVSQNYPQKDRKKILRLKDDDSSQIPLFLRKEDLVYFSAEWCVDEDRKKKTQIASFPCVVFSVKKETAFRIPAVHHQLFVLWLLAKSEKSSFKVAEKLEWEDCRPMARKNVRKKKVLLLIFIKYL
jgi:hypothetical protein